MISKFRIAKDVPAVGFWQKNFDLDIKTEFKIEELKDLRIESWIVNTQKNLIILLLWIF